MARAGHKPVLFCCASNADADGLAAAGLMDTAIGCFMKSEVAMQRRKFSRQFKLEAVKLVQDRGVSSAQASRDLDVHANVLRKWVREFG